MRARTSLFAVVGVALTASAFAENANAPKDNDPYLWLSDINGAKALEWVKGQNAKSDAALKSDPAYKKDYDTILKVLNANDRIPQPDVVDHQWVFNFWQDADHVRGIWRRTTISDYAAKEPHWKVLFDVDKYDRDTGKDWVWQGADCTPSFSRCLVSLSPGGTDAHEVHEFDPKTGKFVDDGFTLAQAKSQARYIDDNTILFATDFGPGSMTPSSYPRIVKVWHRGGPMSAARTVYEAKPDDIGANLAVFHGPYGVVPLVIRRITFFAADYFFVNPDGTTVQIPIPRGADLKGVTQGQLIFTLRDDWTPHSAKKIVRGSLVAFPVVAFAKTDKDQAAEVLYTPGPRAMIAQDVSAGRDAVYAPIYDNVIGSIHEFRLASGRWRDATLALPKDGSTGVAATNDWGPEAYLTYESFIQPPALYQYDASASPREMKSEPARFDANLVTVTQNWATSGDGTKIPYFLIRPRSAKGAIATILYGYGGFELSLNPWYWNDGHRPLDPGQTWFAEGGAIAVANIRGGGEFGPSWHQAALKEHRQRAFDDFAAVARDLERRGLTTSKQLGIVGASNGGVLTTVTMTQHPELLSAVVCQRPLIDMLRYVRFGAGQSWVEEYGDPANAADHVWLAKYSAYENVKPNVGYPPVLFITETTDDRVTPIWARMMAAKMADQGHDVLFYESAEGGHGAGVTHAGEAEYWALSYTFFKQKLSLRDSAVSNASSRTSSAPK
ncbi:MAG TPA: prolyl oligopeptidase family serine peptidase [Rhizomicrobium sp.]|nr:prolyl oligopeptidase family serine peptidase [Rhizomicrobium sp.]